MDRCSLSGCPVEPGQRPHGWDVPDAGWRRAALLPAVIGMSAAGGARGDDPLPDHDGSHRLPTSGCIDAGPRIILQSIRSPDGFNNRPAPDRPDFSRAAGSDFQPDPSADHLRNQSHIAVFLVAQLVGRYLVALGRSGLAGTSGRRAGTRR